MKPLQTVGSEGTMLEGLLPKEVLEIERLKSSIHNTHNCFQDVSSRGHEAIEQILKIYTNASNFLEHTSQFATDCNKIDESTIDELRKIL